MFKRWLSRPTPFVILAVALVVLILYELFLEKGSAADWRYPWLVKLLLLLLAVTALDVLTKYFITKNWLLWLTQLLLCLGFLYYWIVT